MQLFSSIMAPSIGVAASYVAPNRLLPLLRLRPSSYSKLTDPLFAQCKGLFDQPVPCMRTGLETRWSIGIQAQLDIASSGRMEVYSAELYHIRIRIGFDSIHNTWRAYRLRQSVGRSLILYAS